MLRRPGRSSPAACCPLAPAAIRSHVVRHQHPPPAHAHAHHHPHPEATTLPLPPPPLHVGTMPQVRPYAQRCPGDAAHREPMSRWEGWGWRGACCRSHASLRALDACAPAKRAVLVSGPYCPCMVPWPRSAAGLTRTPLCPAAALAAREFPPALAMLSGSHPCCAQSVGGARPLLPRPPQGSTRLPQHRLVLYRGYGGWEPQAHALDTELCDFRSPPPPLAQRCIPLGCPQYTTVTNDGRERHGESGCSAGLAAVFKRSVDLMESGSSKL